MSTALADFLKQQAAERAVQAERSHAVIQEWREAVERLLVQIAGWIKDADPDGGLVSIDTSEITVTEPQLGQYKVPRLDIRTLGRWVGVVPKARYTVGTAHPPQQAIPTRAAGRVDITDELRRYVLYRVNTPGQLDKWLMDDLRNPQRPFDREAFETAFMSYLQ